MRTGFSDALCGRNQVKLATIARPGTCSSPQRVPKLGWRFHSIAMSILLDSTLVKAPSVAFDSHRFNDAVHRGATIVWGARVLDVVNDEAFADVPFRSRVARPSIAVVGLSVAPGDWLE